MKSESVRPSRSCHARPSKIERRSAENSSPSHTWGGEAQRSPSFYDDRRQARHGQMKNELPTMSRTTVSTDPVAPQHLLHVWISPTKDTIPRRRNRKRTPSICTGGHILGSEELKVT